MLAVTAIRTTFTTRLAGVSRSRVGTIGPSSISRVRAAAGEGRFSAALVTAVTHLRRPVVRLAHEVAAPGVERVVHDHAVLQHLVVVRVDVAAGRARSRTGRADCGVRSSREVSAPRTMSASLSRPGASSLYLAMKASKLHFSPTWLNFTPGMS